MTWDGTERRRGDVVNRARRATVDLIQHAPDEAWSGLVLIVIGGWFLLPFPTFSASTSYRWVAETPLTEPALGALLAGIGLAVLGAAVGGRHGPRAAALLGAVWAFLFMGWLYFLSHPYSAGLAIFAPLALAPTWALLRLGRGQPWRRQTITSHGSPPPSRR